MLAKTLVRPPNHNDASLPGEGPLPDHRQPRFAGFSGLALGADAQVYGGHPIGPEELTEPSQQLGLEELHMRGDGRFVNGEHEAFSFYLEGAGAGGEGLPHHLRPTVEDEVDATGLRRTETPHDGVEGHPQLLGSGPDAGKWTSDHA